MALNDISLNTIHSPITSLFDELASCKLTKKKHRVLHTAVEFSPVAKDNEENRLCNAEAASISKVIKRIVPVNSIDEGLTGTKKKTKTIIALNNLDLFSPVAAATSLSGNSTTDVLQPKRCPPSPSEADIADLCALLESCSHSSKKLLARPVDVTQDFDDLVDAILTDVKPYKQKGKLRTSQMLAKEERNIIADERVNAVLVESSGSSRDASDGMRIEMGDFASSGEQDNDDELYLPSPRRHDVEVQVSFASPTPLPLASESSATSSTPSLSINTLPTPQQEVEAQVLPKSLTPSSLIMSSSPSPVYKTAKKSFFGRRRLISDESEEEEEEKEGCHDDSVFYITTTRTIEHTHVPTPAATTTSERKTQKTSTAVKRNDKAKPASDFNDFKTPISHTGTAATTARRRPAATSVTEPKWSVGQSHLAQTCPRPKLHGAMATSLRAMPSSADRGSNTSDFLVSLNKDLPEHRRHVEAHRFVSHFKQLKDELTARLFAIFNETIFSNKLPADMKLVWNNRLTKTAGRCVNRRVTSALGVAERMSFIELSDKILDSADRVRDTLLHELCHAAVWLFHGQNDGHGRLWKAWAGKAHLAHPRIPMVNVCHNYDIVTKYIYECSKCGYRIGRHSKSLDTTRKVCGLCRGTFVLATVNGRTPRSTSSAKSASSNQNRPPLRPPLRTPVAKTATCGVDDCDDDFEEVMRHINSAKPPPRPSPAAGGYTPWFTAARVQPPHRLSFADAGGDDDLSDALCKLSFS